MIYIYINIIQGNAWNHAFCYLIGIIFVCAYTCSFVIYYLLLFNIAMENHSFSVW